MPAAELRVVGTEMQEINHFIWLADSERLDNSTYQKSVLELATESGPVSQLVARTSPSAVERKSAQESV